MARTDQQFPLRLPPELKEKLENACKESGRSKNAEAVYRLEQSFENAQSQESEINELRKEIKNMNMTIHTLAEALVSKGK
ncbi:Arc family DNA-binding protein [Acinetobacter guillouiae]|uniref:Arc family DNA-binding protein n=1 Tax=Acinetobacter guillouiae TaxID=106649 RepID=UPI003C6F9B97